jgi:hypothetical protein
VTRLGEFGPIGPLFTLGSFLKLGIGRSSSDFGATVFYGKTLQINFDKKKMGNILGNFFHKLIWSPCLASQ